MISIIVPVYNTEKYLDKCIQSILNQTYTDLEIIFINDGSTDHSLQILEKYQVQDNRIRIISVENGGQGRARNIGIEQAKGEYIMFVDSDDWISRDCVESLYHTVINEQCDIAIGEYKKTCYEEESFATIFNPPIPVIINKQNKKEFLFKIPTYPFAKLFRKELFVKYEICFPAHYFEDVVTLPLVYAVADKMCYQKEVVYYYRDRAGSTVNTMEFIYDRINCIPTLEKGLKRLGLYKEYEECFREFVLQRSRINRRSVKKLLDRKYREFERRQFISDYQFLGKIDDKKNLKAFVYGSYNLMIAVKIFLRLKNEDNVPNYFGFQNIISSMSPKCTIPNDFFSAVTQAANVFRANALTQDFEKTLLNQKPEHSKDLDYFILDFLDERYDTGHIDNGYFTLSDAFMGIESTRHMDYGVIESFGTEWENIWFEKCDLFIRHIRGIINGGKIILVKMKLSEKYMENETAYLFDNIKCIRDINTHLERCYEYFVQQCPEALIVEVDKLESYYTDKEFRHGCFPWHLNDTVYKTIAQEIKKAVDFQTYKELVSAVSDVRI